jgi:hypothetical protein
MAAGGKKGDDGKKGTGRKGTERILTIVRCSVPTAGPIRPLSPGRRRPQPDGHHPADRRRRGGRIRIGPGRGRGDPRRAGRAGNRHRRGPPAPGPSRAGPPEPRNPRATRRSDPGRPPSHRRCEAPTALAIQPRVLVSAWRADASNQPAKTKKTGSQSRQWRRVSLLWPCAVKKIGLKKKFLIPAPE